MKTKSNTAMPPVHGMILSISQFRVLREIRGCAFGSAIKNPSDHPDISQISQFPLKFIFGPGLVAPKPGEGGSDAPTLGTLHPAAAPPHLGQRCSFCVTGSPKRSIL